MPNPALPIPHDGHQSGWRLYTRRYMDPLGRVMTGTVRVIAHEQIDLPGAVIPTAAGADVDLVHGVLQVTLPEGVYRLFARLQTLDGQELTADEMISV